MTKSNASRLRRSDPADRKGRPFKRPAKVEAAVSLFQRGEFAQAEQLCRSILATNSEHFGALHLLGVCRAQQGAHDEAFSNISAALTLNPRSAEAHSDLGLLLHSVGRHQEAITSCDRALEIKPDFPEALNNRGIALQALNHHEEALRSYEQALAANPGHASAWNNRGTALQALNRNEEAIASYQQALAIKPDYAEAHCNEGLARLAVGDLVAGWEKYEWRWKKKQFTSPKRDFKQPLWLGKEPLAGKTILLHAEQGFGDAIQFIRYAPMVARQGARVLLEVQAPLRRLLEGLEGVERVITKGEALPEFDLHCPLLSLPLAFGTTLESIPAEVPYLHAPTNKIEHWRRRLGASTRPRVGIVWSGRPTHKNDHNRSIPLSVLLALSSPQIELVSLQKELRDADHQVLEAHSEIRRFEGELQDFADTAALTSLMDIVISVDTSVAHLAGALAKPVWILLPFSPDWRWLLNREDSPWYPTARLFRQPAIEDWHSVLDSVRKRLTSTSATVLSRNEPPTELLARPSQPPRTIEQKRTCSSADMLRAAAALLRGGKSEDAERLYRSVLAEDPTSFDALHLLGVCKAQRGDHTAACALIAEALKHNTRSAEAYSNYILALNHVERYDDAIANCDRLLTISPASAKAYFYRGNALQGLRQYADAIVSYDHAVAVQPEFALAHYNRGNALKALNQHEKAIASYEQALRADPDFVEALNNRGTSLEALNRNTEAIESYDHALVIAPDSPDVRYNRALARLALGDLAGGWEDHEWRWKRESFTSPKRDFKQPLWLGKEPLAGKTILLHAEQGFGDAIQFVRYAPMVARQGARVLLEVQAPLRRLLEGFEGVEQVITKGEALPVFDLHCPLMSLPLAFGTTLQTIPAVMPYLYPPAEKTEQWRARLGSRTRPRIGIVWSGRQTHKNDHNRSIPLSVLLALSSPQIELVSLQKELRDADHQVLEAHSEIRRFEGELQDFADTAALVSLMDVVISVDTSVAHLAGALAKTVWILLPFSPDWRWLLNREDSPWYPTARLFRQPAIEDWHTVLDSVRKRLTSTSATVLSRNEPPTELLARPSQPPRTIEQKRTRSSADMLRAAAALLRGGKSEDAERLFRSVLAEDPTSFDALHLLGVCKAKQGDHAESCTLIAEALKHNSRSAEAYSNYILALNHMARYDEAIANCDKLLAIRPASAKAYFYRGNALQSLYRYVDAIASYDQAVSIRPEFAPVLYNRGNALKALGEHEKAVASYEQALQANPQLVEALINRGTSLQALNRNAEAIESYNQALAIAPNSADVRYNRALARLLLGDLAGGWEDHEWRWRRRDAEANRYDFTMWNGDALRPCRLLLWAEQGIGDQIIYGGMVADLVSSPMSLTLEVDARLVTLYQRSFPQVTVLPRKRPPAANPAAYDCQVPFASLGRWLRTSFDAFPKHNGYLKADAEQVKTFSSRLRRPGSETLVGISWYSKNRDFGTNKSTALADWADILSVPGVRFVDLQYGDTAGTRDELSRRHSLEIAHLDDVDLYNDLEALAALCAACDLVITVCNVTAHMAGALGKPVWLLVPKGMGNIWYWFSGRDDSPWYPTARLFRQPAIGDWQSVIERVHRELVSTFSGALDEGATVRANLPRSPHLPSPDKEKPPSKASDTLNKAVAFFQRGKLAEAERLLRSILEKHPNHFDSLHLLGVCKGQQGKHDEAYALIRKALKNNPHSAEAFYNGGKALHALKRHDEAIASYDKALGIKPDYAEALNNRGAALAALKRHEEAIASYHKTLEIKPDFVQALSNRGAALAALNRHEEAIASYDKALAIKPDHAEALNNRGNALQALNRHEEAIASYEQILAIKPDNAGAHFNASLARLTLGDLAAGWEEYEWRWKSKGFTSRKRDFRQPLWLGKESLAGKTILLHAEQGFGDIIQFVRYAPAVVQQGAYVLMEVPGALRGLLGGFQGVEQVITKGQELPKFDLHCPLMSLPLAFHTTLESIPAEVPYLCAPAGKVEEWRQRLGTRTRPRVGIVWSGRLTHKNDQNRSIPLSMLLALAKAGVELVSLQKDVREADREVLTANPQIRDFGSELKNFADTAALVSLLDLVVTVDTAPAHLAGALGKPVWVLLPFWPDWRWLVNREDSPWYPTARLFRQPAIGDWQSAIERVCRELVSTFGRALDEGATLSADLPRSPRLPSPDKEKPPSKASDTLNKAVAFFERGNLAQAERLLCSILAKHPNHFDSLHLLGVCKGQQGKHDKAYTLISEALRNNPHSAEALYNRGNALQALKRHDEAIASYDEALAIKPDYAETLNNRGNAQAALNRREEAITSYDKALALKPDYAEALNNRGNVLQALKRHREAIASYDRALTIQPDCVDALNNRGNALKALNQHEEAIASYEKALTIKPDLAEALNNRGNALKALNRHEEAIASYEKALAIKPYLAEALNNRGNLLARLRRYDEAIASYDKAIAVNPDSHYAPGQLAYCRAHTCDWRISTPIGKNLVDDVRSGRPVSTPFSFLAISNSPADQLTCATTYVRDRFPAVPSQLRTRVRFQNDKIRVAYLSADFYEHATAYLIAELFERHDRASFEIVGISFGSDQQSAMRTRLMAAFDRFEDVRRVSDTDVATLLREAKVNIAIDLKGFTTDCRLGIFAHRPAPIQATYLGYPGTTGADYIDYIIADEFVIPRDDHAYYSEKVVYLPNCYQVNDSKRKMSKRMPTRAAVGLPEDGFVFCCFNNSYKLTPQIFDVWMRLLERVDQSVLWLLQSSASAESNLRREARMRGVNPDRLVFAPKMDPEHHLARHQLADLFLDTLPVNAHTTASDALWAGLPVLTCAGGTFAGRVAGSLLHAVGLPELVTDTLEDYEALAFELATQNILLLDIKKKLARNRLTAPLFDPDLFRRHIEAAYMTMWELYQSGNEPTAFAVPSADS